MAAERSIKVNCSCHCVFLVTYKATEGKWTQHYLLNDLYGWESGISESPWRFLQVFVVLNEWLFVDNEQLYITIWTGEGPALIWRYSKACGPINTFSSSSGYQFEQEAQRWKSVTQSSFPAAGANLNRETTWTIVIFVWWKTKEPQKNAFKKVCAHGC